MNNKISSLNRFINLFFLENFLKNLEKLMKNPKTFNMKNFLKLFQNYFCYTHEYN